METSDHTPYAISVSTKIPTRSIFRFENHWLEHPEFLSVVQQHWTSPTHLFDAAKILTAKFKNLRTALKIWKANLSNLKSTIGSVKVVLDFLQVIEEFRDLSVPEWNFRSLLESKLQNLLKQQKIYWQQRGQVKWVTLGDAGTKFFHAHATIKYRKNLITSLENENGETVFDHKQKAQLIWLAIKERLGVSEFTDILFNLDHIMQATVDLSSLQLPFAKEEIDYVVRSLPSDKSPSPDGFNTDFVKKCWFIICEDF